MAGSEFVGLSVGSGDGEFAGGGVDGDAPASFVDTHMVISTKPDEGGDVGASAVDPGQQVVDVYPRGGDGAPGPAAASVAGV